MPIFGQSEFFGQFVIQAVPYVMLEIYVNFVFVAIGLNLKFDPISPNIPA